MSSPPFSTISALFFANSFLSKDIGSSANSPVQMDSVVFVPNTLIIFYYDGARFFSMQVAYFLTFTQDATYVYLLLSENKIKMRIPLYLSPPSAWGRCGEGQGKHTRTDNILYVLIVFQISLLFLHRIDGFSGLGAGVDLG